MSRLKVAFVCEEEELTDELLTKILGLLEVGEHLDVERVDDDPFAEDMAAWNKLCEGTD